MDNKPLVRLKELRKKENISLQTLSSLVDISFSSLSAYERGARKPKYEQLEKLANHFNVDVSYLIGESNVPNSTFDIDYILDNHVSVSDQKQLRKAEFINDSLKMGHLVLSNATLPKQSDVNTWNDKQKIDLGISVFKLLWLIKNTPNIKNSTYLPADKMNVVTELLFYIEKNYHNALVFDNDTNTNKNTKKINSIVEQFLTGLRQFDIELDNDIKKQFPDVDNA